MEDFQQNSLNVSQWTEQLRLFKKLAGKYGLAMIVLSLNHFVTPFVFVIIFSIIGGILHTDLLAEDTEIGYYSMMVLNELSAYVVPVLALWFLFREDRKEFRPDRTYNPRFYEAIIMFAASMTAGSVGSIVTQLINSAIDAIFHTGEIEEVFSGMEPANLGQFGIFAFCICIVAPVAEEYMFRDLMLKPLRAFGDLTAAVVTGIMFGLYHGNFDQFAYASIVGFFYSVIAIRFNSILPTVILHCINNTIVTFGTYLEGATEGADETVKNICITVADTCSVLSVLMMAAGALGLVYVIAEKCFKLHNHNLFVPEPHSLVEFIKVPLVIVGIVAMFVPFVFSVI